MAAMMLNTLLAIIKSDWHYHPAAISWSPPLISQPFPPRFFKATPFFTV